MMVCGWRIGGVLWGIKRYSVGGGGEFARFKIHDKELGNLSNQVDSGGGRDLIEVGASAVRVGYLEFSAFRATVSKSGNMIRYD